MSRNKLVKLNDKLSDWILPIKSFVRDPLAIWYLLFDALYCLETHYAAWSNPQRLSDVLDSAWIYSMKFISLLFKCIILAQWQSAAFYFSATEPFLFLNTPHRLLFADKKLESVRSYSKLMRGREFPQDGKDIIDPFYLH